MTDWIEKHHEEQRTKKKGGPGSGHWGHAGRPGERGGSLPGKTTGGGSQANGGSAIATSLLARGDGTELYRWVNLGEVVELARGHRRTSLDLTSDPDLYFAPPSSSGVGKGRIADVYLRLVLDKKKLAQIGWEEIPGATKEALWRIKGSATSDRDIASGFSQAIDGVEIHDRGEMDLQDVADIIEYRLGRQVPISDVTQLQRHWRSPSTPPEVWRRRDQ